MEDFINKIEKIKEIDEKIKECQKEKRSYMTAVEMTFIEQKCKENRAISIDELKRYSKAGTIEWKLFDLTFKKEELLAETRQKYKTFKEFYKKYLVDGEV